MTEAHKLSVCICTYKRPHMLEQLLLNLDLCTRSEFFNFSVIVVDNDTLQSAEATVKGMQRKVSFEIKYCIEHHPAIPKARNRAVREADGNFIVFIDDDEIPSAEWLLNLYKTAQKYRVDGVLRADLRQRLLPGPHALVAPGGLGRPGFGRSYKTKRASRPNDPCCPRRRRGGLGQAVARYKVRGGPAIQNAKLARWRVSASTNRPNA